MKRPPANGNGGATSVSPQATGANASFRTISKSSRLRSVDSQQLSNRRRIDLQEGMNARCLA